PESTTGWSQLCCFGNSEDPSNCYERPCRPRRVCGPCQCDPRTDTWSHQCCLPDGTNCSRQSCAPPDFCTTDDDRTCLPWPFDWICWGSCTRTCCRWAACDLLLC